MPSPPSPESESAFPSVSYQEWRRRVLEEIGGEVAFEERLASETLEGIRLEALHARQQPGVEALVVPAPAPGPWGLWFRCESGDPERAVASMREGASLDAAGAWLRLDEAGRRGLDSDFEEASALVGRGGVAFSAAPDLEPLLALGLSRNLALGLEAGAQALPSAALVLAAAEEAGGSRQLCGCLGADPLGALAAGEALDLPSQLDEMASLALWAAAKAPGLRAVRVATAPYHEAGADAVQEIAFALATGVAYLRQLTAAGLGLEEASRQILFVFEVGRDLYLQLAKLRAARATWAMVLAAVGKEGEAPGPGMTMALHARTSWRTKSIYDRWSNLLRETVEGIAGVLGGAQEVTLRPFDEVVGEGSASARRLTLTTQLVLREEAQLDRVTDPAAGSWSQEYVTRELARRAWELFQSLENGGGMAGALAPGGAVEGMVSQAAARRRREIAMGRFPMVGASVWANLQDQAIPEGSGEPAPGLLSARRERLRHLRSRERSAAFDALDVVRRRRGRADSELVEALVEAAKGGATLAQLVESLERPGPEHRGPALPAWRDAEPFESLRAAVDQHHRVAGRRPALLLLELAPHAELAGTSAWARRLLASAGLEGREVPGPLSPDEAMALAGRQEADGIVLVPPRPPDPVRMAIYADALRHAGSSLVGSIGRPIPSVAGAVDFWLQEGEGALESLRQLLRRLGVAA